MRGRPKAGRRSTRSTPPPGYSTWAGSRLATRRWSDGRGILGRLATAVWESSWLVRQSLVALLVLGVLFAVMRASTPLLAGLQGQVRYYLTTDLDLRGATQQVFSSGLREQIARGWRVFPELWDRLTGRDDQELDDDVSFAMPVEGTVTSGFGYRPDPITGEVTFHTGIDIGATEGTPVVAALAGTVTNVAEDDAYGKYLEIDHGQGIVTLYAHARDILVSVGDPVSQGQTVALVGMTGRATTTHCHFEVVVSGQPVDPLQMKGLSDSQ